MTRFLPILFFVLISEFVVAQRVEPNRADQAEGASTLEKTKLVLESSAYYTVVDKSQTSWISSSMVRYGLLKNLEFRVLIEQGSKEHLFFTETSHSQYPLALGLKYALLKDKPGLPDITASGFLEVPIANGKENSQWSPSFNLIAEQEWKPVALIVNIGIGEAPFEHEWQWHATGTLQFDINPHLQAFAEYFATYSKEPPFHNADLGLIYFVSKRFTVHVAAGHSIDHNPENYFVNTGLTLQVN